MIESPPQDTMNLDQIVVVGKTFEAKPNRELDGGKGLRDRKLRNRTRVPVSFGVAARLDLLS